MKTKISRLCQGHQSGLTLLELVMAMGAAGVLMAAVTLSVVTLLNTNTRNTNHMVAVRSVQNAGYWISHDGEMANWILGVSTNLTGTNFLQLKWRDPNVPYSANHTSVYTLDARGNLYRNLDNAGPSLVAEHIQAVSSANYTKSNNTLTLTVSASVTTRNITGSESRVYRINPRPSPPTPAP